MPTQKQHIFAYLDDQYGGESPKEILEDYETKEKFLKMLIEEIQEDDGLTYGCGVGPVIGYINEWLENFFSGKKNETDTFLLSIKFSPTKLGYDLFKDECMLKKSFPNVKNKPKSYPVVAIELLM